MTLGFTDALAMSESGNRSNITNSEGYTGIFQWGQDRLTDFNRANGTQYTMEEFKNNADLQRFAQQWAEDDIIQYAMDNGLDYYFGKKVGGVEITPTALLGMAHLGGKAGMKRFVETGGRYNPADSNGTTLAAYGAKFSGTPAGYELSNPGAAVDLSLQPAGDFSLGQPAEGDPSSMETMMMLLKDSCPAGSQFDPKTMSCVPIPVRPMPRPQQQEQEMLPPPDTRPMPRPQQQEGQNRIPTYGPGASGIGAMFKSPV